MPERQPMPSLKRLMRLSFGSTVLIRFIGILAMVLLGWWSLRAHVEGMQSEMLAKAKIAANAVNWRYLEKLSASEADLESLEYQRLKEQLTAINSANPLYRFSYLLGQHPDGSIFFFVDSEPPDSKDYSPPGQLYTEVPASIRQLFASGQASAVGPYNDRWGKWLSALVPVKNPQTGKLLALFGMDRDANDWNMELALDVAEQMALVTILVIPLAAFLVKRRNRESILHNFQTFFNSVGDHIVVLDSKSAILQVNETALSRLGYPIDDLLGQPFAVMHPPEKREEIAKIVSEMQTGQTRTFPVTLMTKEGGLIPVETRISHGTWNGRSALFVVSKDLTEHERSEAKLRETNTFLHSLLNAIPVPVYYKDQEARYLGVNKSFEEFHGKSLQELIGKRIFDIAPMELAELSHAKDRELLQHGGTQVYDLQAMNSRNETRDVVFHKAAFTGSNGQICGLIGAMIDITEGKRMETELRESRQYLSDIIQFFPDATVVIDNQRKVTAWNLAMEELSGVKAEEMLGKGDYEYALPFYSKRRPILLDLVTLPEKELEGRYPQIKRQGDTLVAEAYIHNARGEELYFHGTAAALRNTHGEIIGAIESVRDVTTRKRIEEENVFKNIILSTQQDVSPDGVLVVDEDGAIISYNQRFIDLWGIPPEIVESRDDAPVLQFAASKPSDKEGFLARVRYLYEHRDEKSREEIALKDGRIIDRYSAPMTGADGKYYGRVWYFRDITEQKNTERRLTQSEKFLADILDCIQDAITILDRDLRIIRVNPVMEKAFSDRMPLVGRKCYEVFYGRTEPCESCPSLETLNSGKPASKIFPFVENGAEVWLELTTSPLLDSVKSDITGVIEVTRHITERKQNEEQIRRLNAELGKKVEERTGQLIEAQEQLVRREKLSILGQLCGSVGHELRNPLGVMNNAIYFLKMIHTEADETTKEYLDMIKHEIDTSQRIINDMLDFARTKTPQPQTVAVRQLLEDSLGKCLIPPNVELQVILPDTLPSLKVDPLQMGQVFQNLITNAIQAMPQGGFLRLSAQQLTDAGPALGDSPVSVDHNGSPQPGSEDCIAISVADTGEGIAPENMKNLFQPLFTTKAKGIGLGLVVCKNITEANGGDIRVESRLGEGTIFHVTLPLCRS